MELVVPHLEEIARVNAETPGKTALVQMNSLVLILLLANQKCQQVFQESLSKEDQTYLLESTYESGARLLTKPAQPQGLGDPKVKARANEYVRIQLDAINLR